jgi:hypothetical protein
MGSYIPQDDIVHSHRRENLKPYFRIVFICFLYQNKFYRGDAALL